MDENTTKLDFVLSFSSSVTLDKLISLLLPQFPHLQNGDNKTFS